MELQAWLVAHGDPKRAQFAQKLMPNNSLPIYGVRLGELRKLAKQIAKDPVVEIPTDCFEGRMLLGFVIGYLRISEQERLQKLQEYLSLITNWSLCDSVACTLRHTINKQELALYQQQIPLWLSTPQTYTIRFALVLMLVLFCTAEYYHWCCSLLAKYLATNEEYYVCMAEAWLLTEFALKLKNEEQVLTFTKEQLNDSVLKKVQQKLRESLRKDWQGR